MQAISNLQEDGKASCYTCSFILCVTLWKKYIEGEKLPPISNLLTIHVAMQLEKQKHHIDPKIIKGLIGEEKDRWIVERAVYSHDQYLQVFGNGNKKMELSNFSHSGYRLLVLA